MPYAPGLDGVRAIAVVAVLLYHGQDVGGIPSWLEPRGGFLGVEVFFVISGFLITALLLGENARSATIDLRSFWERRARRLLPALIGFLVGVTVLAAVFADDALDTIRDEILGALFYVSNWVLIANDQSYFEAAGRPSLLRHLWSLAIEGQFYVLWPLVVVLLLRRLGVRSLLGVALAGVAGSTALLWVLFDRVERFGDVSEVYYRTDARAGALLIGAALACVWRPWEERSAPQSSLGRRVVDGVGVIGLVGVIAAQFVFTDRVIDWHLVSRLYHGGFGAVSLLTALVIAAVMTPGSVLGRLLGTPILRWVGVRSYGIYLWHWPVFQLTRPRVDVELDGWRLLSMRWLVTLVLVEISYRLIEVPARRGRFLQSLRRTFETPRGILLGTAGALAVVGATAGIAASIATVDHGSTESVQVVTEVDPAPELATAAPPSPTPTATPLPTPTPSSDALVPDAPAAGPIIVEIPSTPIPEAPAATPTPLPTPTQAPVIPAPPLTGSVDLATSRIYIFGDSVILGAQAQLSRISPLATVDGRIGRQWWEAGAELEAARAAGYANDVVIIQLGNNGSVNGEMFGSVMQALAGTRLVLFVNVRAPLPWEAEVNGALARYVSQVPDRARLIDWYTASNAHPEYFIEDATHLSGPGQVAFRRVIEAALSELS